MVYDNVNVPSAFAPSILATTKTKRYWVIIPPARSTSAREPFFNKNEESLPREGFFSNYPFKLKMKKAFGVSSIQRKEVTT